MVVRFRSRLSLILSAFSMAFLFYACASGEKGFRKDSALLGVRVNTIGYNPLTRAFCFVHIVRDQECSPCSVGTLYHWDEIIAMIGRDDISYLFIVEPNGEDTEEVLNRALQRRSFKQPVVFDWNHSFIRNNPWLIEHPQWNDFLLDSGSKIVAIGDPLNDYHFWDYMKTVSKTSTTFRCVQ